MYTRTTHYIHPQTYTYIHTGREKALETTLLQICLRTRFLGTATAGTRAEEKAAYSRRSTGGVMGDITTRRLMTRSVVTRSLTTMRLMTRSVVTRRLITMRLMTMSLVTRSLSGLSTTFFEIWRICPK